jgi:hypothetical protein
LARKEMKMIGTLWTRGEKVAMQAPCYSACWDLRVWQSFGNGVSMLSETFYCGYLPYHITILPLAVLRWELGSRMTPTRIIRRTRTIIWIRKLYASFIKQLLISVFI